MAGTLRAYHSPMQSHLMMVKLPEQFTQKEKNWVFQDLFSFFTNEMDVVPIGLMRMGDLESEGTIYPFVITCPAPQLTIEPTDLVYILIQMKGLEKVRQESKSGYNMWEFQIQEKQ